MMFMFMSVVGVEFGVAVSRHTVCSSYVCTVCCALCAVRYVLCVVCCAL